MAEQCQILKPEQEGAQCLALGNIGVGTGS